jgi:cytoplasmic iron level regulating protein YaaA (DUF328/UPF0246 family)
MIILLSPAKSQNFSPHTYRQFTLPRQLENSIQLIDTLTPLTVNALGSLMKMSEKLSLLNWQRIQNFKPDFSMDNAKQALLAFTGDVYKSLSTHDYNHEDFNFAQQHVRILSGLYGVLRPLDLIQPYRLEMGTRLQTPQGKNLYDFWGNQITELLNQDLNHQRPTCLNLASNEYFKAIKPQHLHAKIITITFKEMKTGGYKVIAIHAKRARGLMANFIIKNRIVDRESLKTFTLENYQYNPALSSKDEWVFSR